MAWYEILITIIGGLGGITGMTALYKAKPEKNSLEIENFMKLLNEAQEEREKLKIENNTFKLEMENKIKELNTKIDELRKRDNKNTRAINSAYRCLLPKSLDECPVLKIFNTSVCNLLNTEEEKEEEENKEI